MYREGVELELYSSGSACLLGGSGYRTSRRVTASLETGVRRREFLRMLCAGAGAVAVSSFGACSVLTARTRLLDVVQVGAVGLFPADRKEYEGELPEDALAAAVGRLNALGGLLGRQVGFRGAHAGTEEEAFEGFRRLSSDPTVIGVVLAGPLGAERIADEASRVGMPVVSAAFDFTLQRGLAPEDPNRETLFQFAIPTAWSLDVLARYCSADRGYRRFGLLFDEVQYSLVDVALRRAATESGADLVLAEPVAADREELRRQLRRLSETACQALFVWTDAATLASVVEALDAEGFAYRDVEAARVGRGQGWAPQVVAAPAAAGERDWAVVAGEAARPGTVTAGDIGAFRKGPEWLPEVWGNDHVSTWNRKENARRGLRAVVDSLYVLVEAARRSGRADREAVAEQLLGGGEFQFASTKFELSRDKRVALTPDDLCVMAMERDQPQRTTPRYELGREWRDGLAEAPDMTVLLRPTLERNLRRAPEWVAGLLRGGYGLQCAKIDGGLSPACKIH